MTLCGRCVRAARRIAIFGGRKPRAVDLAHEEIITWRIIHDRYTTDGVCDICGDAV